MGVTTDRSDPGIQKIRADGQQETYLVLTVEERAKGLVRPVRRSYKHLACGHVTNMGQEIAESYARKPDFYTGTFCCACAAHFPLRDADGHKFEWVDDGTAVGS